MEEDTFLNASATNKDGLAGDRRYFKGFLAKMNLIFMLDPERFANDPIKVAYIISRIYGSAMNWAATLIENNDPCLNNYQQFTTKFKATFGSYDWTFIANQKLKTIKQGRIGEITRYILEFNRYSDESSWNEEAKMDPFLYGLNDQIATKIYEMFPGPRSLLALQTIASRLDNGIAAHKQFSSPQNRSNNNNNNDNKNNNRNNNNRRQNKRKKPFKFNTRGPLSKEEKERRRKEHLCVYCRSADHSLDYCPLVNRNKAFSGSSHITNLEPKTIPRIRISDQPDIKLPIFEFSLNVSNISTKAKILLDCCSQLNLMDVYFAKENNIPYSSECNLPNVSGIGGIQSIIGKTAPIYLKYKNHICKTSFYVVDLPSYCAILGIDWLETHNPIIDFASKELSFKSNYCISNCLVLPRAFTTYVPLNTIKKNDKEEDKESNKINKSLPKKLLPFKDVFSEIYVNELPPHRPYDCEIKLMPNTVLFYGPIYPLTEKESTTLKEYIDEMLAKGFIRKSKSPAGTPVFFVLKKNGELRMVVDYRHLNDITIRDSYPLLLINDMLEQLAKGKVFSKLDLPIILSE